MRLKKRLRITAWNQLDELLLTLNGRWADPGLYVDYEWDYADPDDLDDPGEVQILGLDNEALKRAEAKRDELQKYVDGFIRCDRNLKKWVDKNPKLFADINTHLATLSPQIVIRQLKGGKVKARILASSWVDFDGIRSASSPSDSKWLFANLLINPLAGSILRCDRCKRYFVPVRYPNKKFCSRKCALRSSALKSTKALRAAQRAEKLEACKAALAGYRKIKAPRDDWKTFVQRKANVSKTWLTRIVNSGELFPP